MSGALASSVGMSPTDWSPRESYTSSQRPRGDTLRTAGSPGSLCGYPLPLEAAQTGEQRTDKPLGSEEDLVVAVKQNKYYFSPKLRIPLRVSTLSA